MQTSDAGAEFEARREGVVLRAYPDPATHGEPWTIGAGHTSAGGPPPVRPGMVLPDRAAAITILHSDLGRGVDPVIAGAVKLALQQHEWDACSSLCLNIGGRNFAGSSVVRHLNAGDRAAAASFASWRMAAGHVMAGLVARRAAEAHLFLTGDYGLAAVPAHDVGEAAGVMLRRGSPHADAVRALQSDLKALGAYAGRIDGDFGKQTERALMAFQRAAGHLDIDGIAGPATRAAIAGAMAARKLAAAVPMHPLPGQPIQMAA
jgi:lysozyme